MRRIFPLAVVVYGVAALSFQSDAYAKPFDADQKLKVFERLEGDLPDRILGFTPVKTPKRIQVPWRGLWYVAPVGPLSDIRLAKLGDLLSSARVPGLDLSEHWDVTDAALPFVAKAPKLRILILTRTRISDAGLAPVASLVHLRILALGSHVSDKGLKSLGNLHELRDLDLQKTKITDDSCEIIAAFPLLAHLDLMNTKTSDACIARLSHVRKLRTLALSAHVTDAGAASIAKLQSLESLDLSQTQLSEKGLRIVATLPRLRTLFLNPQTTDAGVEAVSRIPTLRTLDITQSLISDKASVFLGRLRGLEELALSQTHVSDATLGALTSLSSLRLLEISGTSVTSEGLRVLSTLPRLKTLSLSWSKLKTNDIQNLAALPKLKTIILYGVPLSLAAMEQLQRLARAPTRAPIRVKPCSSPAPIVLSPDQNAARLPRTERISSIPAAPLSPGVMPKLLMPSRVGTTSDLQVQAAGPAYAPSMETSVAPSAETVLKTIQISARRDMPIAPRPFGGVRRVRQVETNVAALNDIIAAPSNPSAEMPNESPESSVGEVQIGAAPNRSHRP